MAALAIALGAAALTLSAPPVAPVGLPGVAAMRVSGGSPFPRACAARGAQRASEVEPSIASSPAAPGLLVTAWQQDRYARAAAAGIGASVSRDGGASWAAADVPGITECTRLRRYASDPWVSIGPDGRIYLAALRARPSAAGFRTRVAVASSGDGGASWGLPALLDAGGNGFNDKPSVTADPLRPRTAYAVWTLQASAFMARTTDGGRSWSPPRAIRRRPAHGGTVASTISVLPDGSLLHTFLAYGLGGLRVETARSRDGGARWSPPVRVARVPRRRGVLRAGRPPVRALALSGTGAAVTASGTVYEAVVRGGRAIALVRSLDGGRSWAPAGSVAPRRRAAAVFGPALAAGPGGLALSYYAHERGGRASFWIARSAAGGSRWRQRRIGVPFSLRSAPRSGHAAFFGDYSGLTALAGGGFAAAFAAAQPLAARGRSDVLVAGSG